MEHICHTQQITNRFNPRSSKGLRISQAIDNLKWQSVVISPEKTLSLTKSQSISIHLVLAWKTRLDAKCSVASLSHISFNTLTSPNFSCRSICLNHVSSQVDAAIIWYSASALDLSTMFYFLIRNEIKSFNEDTMLWCEPTI